MRTPEPGGDMLHRDIVTPHERVLPVLGVPTRFACADPALLEEVDATFGPWRALAARTDLIASCEVRIRISFHDDDPADAGAPAVRYRVAEPGRLVLATPGSLGFADQARDEGVLWVTPSLVRDPAHFRFAVLSAITLFLVTGHDRRPVHAGAVGGRSAALLLHGPSGAGKSTLALACARAGLVVLAEDAVYAQAEGPFRIWGYPGPLHLAEGALRFFPDLPSTGGVVRGPGEPKLAVPLPSEARDPVPVRERAGICLVRRSRGAPRVERARDADVVEAVARPSEPGFDVFRGRMDEVAGRLAAAGAWVLHVGSDPAAAAARVAELLDEVERGGAA